MLNRSSREHPARADGQVAAQRLPALAEVLGHEHVGLVVIGAMGVEADIGPALDEARRLDAGHPARPGKADLVCHVGPPGAAVAGDPQVAVVGAGPQDVGVARRLGQGGGGAARGARNLRRDRSGVAALLQRTEDIIAAAVADVRVVAGQDERRVPVEAIRFQFLLLLRAQAGALAGAQVAPAHAAVLGLEINQVGVLRIDPAHKAVAAADDDPVLVDGPDAGQAEARPAPAAVVLQAAVDAIRAPAVHGDVIELADGQVIEEVPVVHAIVGDIDAAVAAEDHVPAVAGIDPQGVLVRMGAVAAVGLERLAAVRGAIEGDAEDVEMVLVARIDADLAEIHGPGIDAVDARPGLAAVGGAVDAAVFVSRWGPACPARFRAGRRTRSCRAGLSPGPRGEPPRTTVTVRVSLPRSKTHLDFVAGLVGADLLDEVLVGFDVLLVDGLDDVAGLEAGLTGGAVRQ